MERTLKREITKIILQIVISQIVASTILFVGFYYKTESRLTYLEKKITELQPCVQRNELDDVKKNIESSLHDIKNDIREIRQVLIGNKSKDYSIYEGSISYEYIQEPNS